MRLRRHRRNLVVWSSAASSAGRYGGPTFFRTRQRSRLRRLVRTGGLLTLVGLVGLARVIRPRWRPLLAGLVLTTVGFMLRDSAWGLAFLLGILFLFSAVLIPDSPDDHRRQLARELAAYSSRAQRGDLEATFDRYPDTITHDLRDILASQAVVAASGDASAGPGAEPKI